MSQLPQHPGPEAARASLYRLLATAFSYPDADLHQALSTGEFHDAIWTAQDALSVARTGLPEIRCDHQQWEAGYIRIFEIGGSGESPCVLRESAHSDGATGDAAAPPAVGRVALFEDLLRFYHHFGLRMTDVASDRELPDHLSCQLEMLSFLCLRESLAGAGHESAEWYRRAQLDFLQRHLCSWVPRLAESLRCGEQSGETERFYGALAEATVASIAAHLGKPR